MYYNNIYAGLYNEAFIHIRLNTKDPSTLIHEYIHYLQAISTLYGLYTFKFWKQDLERIIAENRSVDEKSLDMNYENYKYNYHSLLESKGASHGSNPLYYKDIKFIKIEKKVDTFALQFWKEDTVFNYEMLMLVDGKIYNYCLGANYVSESMARLIQQHCYPSITWKTSLPYNSCEEIVNWYYPEFGKNKGNIVALCDLSLLSEMPGASFIYLLHIFKQEKFIPKRVKEIYDFHENRHGYVNENGEKYKLGTAQFKKLRDNITEIDNLYNKNGFHDDVNKWIKEKFFTAAQYRSQNNAFISELMELDAEAARSHITDVLMRKLDIPITIDADDFIYSGSPNLNNENLHILLAENEIYNVLYTKKPCRMQNICKKNGCFYKVDERCKTPWLKSQDKYLCPFGVLWHKWDLKNITV